MSRNQNLRDHFELDDVYSHPGWRQHGSTPDVRPPYLASYGLHGYDPDANWAAARRSSWGVRAPSRALRYGMEGAPGVAEVGGFGLEGGYGATGRAVSSRGAIGTAPGMGRSLARHGLEGRGPKGYTRSDARIEEDVNEILTRDPELDASDIEVRVSRGEVELTGTVYDRWAKRRAYDDADSCPGVRDVHSRLTLSYLDEH